MTIVPEEPVTAEYNLTDKQAERVRDALPGIAEHLGATIEIEDVPATDWRALAQELAKTLAIYGNSEYWSDELMDAIETSSCRAWFDYADTERKDGWEYATSALTHAREAGIIK